MKYLAPIPKQFVDHDGLPLSNGAVHVYISGDTQYANVYQDADGNELMPNPARLDSNGAWLGFVTAGIPLDYVVEDKEGNVQFSYQKVVAAQGGSGSQVAIEPTLSSGTKIAECWVDGELLELFAPDGGGGPSTMHHLAVGQYGYLVDVDNNGDIVTDQVLDGWMRDNEDVVLYDSYEDASGYSNKPYIVQWYDASSTFTEGSTKIRFSRVGDASTPAKLTLYGFASDSNGYMKSATISGNTSPWTVDVGSGGSYTAGAGIDIANGVISRRVQIVTTSSSYTYVKNIIDAGDLPVLDKANGSLHDLYVCTMYRGSDIQFVGSSYGQTTLYNLASNNTWTSHILEPQITAGNANRILAVNAAGTDAEWRSWVPVPSYAFADSGKLLKVVHEGGNLGLKWDQPSGYVPWETDWASGYTNSHTVTAEDVVAGYFDMYQAFASGADTASAIFDPIRAALTWDTQCLSGPTSNYVSSIDFAIGVDGGSFRDMFTDNAPAHEVHKDWYLYPHYLLHTRCNRIRIRYHLTANATEGTQFSLNISGLVDQVR